LFGCLRTGTAKLAPSAPLVFSVHARCTRFTLGDACKMFSVLPKRTVVACAEVVWLFDAVKYVSQGSSCRTARCADARVRRRARNTFIPVVVDPSARILITPCGPMRQVFVPRIPDTDNICGCLANIRRGDGRKRDSMTVAMT